MTLPVPHRVRRAAARFVLRPFRALIALVFALTAVAFFAGLPQPVSVDQFLPDGLRAIWAGCLLGGGLLLLAGLASGYRPVEAAGLWLLAAGALVYSLAAFTLAGRRATLPAGLALAVAVASLVDTADTIHDWAQTQLRDQP